MSFGHRFICLCGYLCLWSTFTAPARCQETHFSEYFGPFEPSSTSRSISEASGALVPKASAATSSPAPPPAQNGQAAGSTSFSYQLGLSGLFSFGYSDAKGEDLEAVQGGGHDPNRNGFTVQNVELAVTGAVDPYFDAGVFIVYQIDAEGETVVELEEAYFSTRSLPGGLQVKGGQFFTEFGRFNPRHPHQWSFVDQPVIMTRIFGGDGLRSQGARLSWLMPTPAYSELLVGLYNAKGETAVSFLGEEGEEIAGFPLDDRRERDLGDLLYSMRWLTGLDLSRTTSLNMGLSALSGPNASGPNNRTRIYGADSYLKWQAARSDKGFPFVAWHTELVYRNYEAGEVPDPVELKDRGGFSELTWGYRPREVVGLRAEWANANDRDPADPLRDKRTRYSVNWTWYPTEFSKIRLQYNRDRLEFLAERDLNSLWLSLEVNLGKHMAHTF